MGSPSVLPGIGIGVLDEGMIIGLGIALASAGAPSPLIFAIPAACEGFVAVAADPFAWFSASDSWSAIRDVTSAAAANLTNNQKALLADAWQDDGALEFRKYGDRMASAVTALNGLVDATAQECAAIGGLFLQVQIEFIIEMTTAILEAVAAGMLPDPTMTTQTVLKTIIIGVALGMLGVLVYAVVNYINTMTATNQKIASAYDALAAQLHDANGKLSGAAANLDPARMATIADPHEWKLAEIPPNLLQ